jgi:predicted DNA-binding transcriptional regulator AlpA
MHSPTSATLEAEPATSPPMTGPAKASLAEFDTLPNAAHVRLPVVRTLYGVGPASIWRWVKAGRLPKPVKVGMQAVAWNVGELRQHLAQCRDGK